MWGAAALLRWGGASWRHLLWERGGAAITASARALGAEVRPRWRGFEARQGEVRVAWWGGLDGLRTGVWVRGSAGTKSQVFDGIASPEALAAEIAALRGSPGT